MRLLLFVTATVMMSTNVAARADTFNTFQFQLIFQHGQSATGQVTLDTTTDEFTSLEGVYDVGTGPLNGISSQGVYKGSYYFISTIAPNNYLEVFLPVTNLIGYTGSAVCSGFSNSPGCSSFGYIIADAYSSEGGSLTPVLATAVTPEPSSFAFLGTGMLGIAGVVRKRSTV